MGTVAGKMAKWLPKSIRMQIGVSFMLTSLLILLFSAVVIYNGELRLFQKRTEESTLQLFRQADYTIQGFRKEVDTISKTLLIDEDVQRFLDQPPTETVDQIYLHTDILGKIASYLNTYNYLHSIYIYGDGGSIVGSAVTRSRVLDDPDKLDWFYTTFMHTTTHKDAQGAFPKLVWVGGNEEAYFEGEKVVAGSEERNLLSAARAVKSVYQKTPSGTLVINVFENHLSLQYNQLSDHKDSRIYIVDGEGRVVSTPDKPQLGEASAAYAEIPADSVSGSFRSGGMQIVYLHLTGVDWTLVKEIPISEYVRDIVHLRSNLIWIVLVGLLLSIVMSSFWIRRINRPLVPLMEAMSRVEQGQLGISLSHPVMSTEFGKLSRGFNRMSAGIKDLMDNVQRAEDEKRQIEILMLQAYINPHFLFNTLNTIKWMGVVAKTDNIVGAITALSDMLRPTFKNPTLLCSLQEELEYIRNYILIMNYRFGQGIELEIRIDEALSESAVPRFILQPIVENAISHGFEYRQYVGLIRISAAAAAGGLTLAIADDGIGMDESRLASLRLWLDGDRPAEMADTAAGSALAEAERPAEPAQRHGIGLQNVHRRIRLLFGDAYGMQVDSALEAGTTITLRLPTDAEAKSGMNRAK